MLTLPHQTLLFLNAYGITTVTRATELGGGMFLRPLMIETAASTVVLRRHGFRSSEEVFRFQAEAVEFAASHGVRCARVIRRLDGRFGEVRDGAFWALHEYIDGQPLPWPKWAELKDQPGFMRQLGARIALLHDSLRELPPGGDPHLSVDCPPVQFDFLDDVRAHWRSSMRSLQDANLEATRSRDLLCENRHVLEDHWDWAESVWKAHGHHIPRQVVHGDLSPVNMVYQPDAQDFALIDWDNLHVGLRLYDALGDVQNRAPADTWETARLRVDHVREYLAGYAATTTVPLSNAEKACIPMFCVARHLEDLRQRLHVLTSLATDRDIEYSKLITIRLRFMTQVRDLLEKHEPWT